MASIISRNNKFCVVLSYVDGDGNRKQKWETFNTLAEAKRRKTEIEYQQQLGDFTVPTCTNLMELLDEYVNLYGKTKWSMSMYSSNTSMIRNYIIPFLGNMELKEITARVLEKYYQTLLKTPTVARMTDRNVTKVERLIQPATVRKIHCLLRSAFNQAEKWELIEKNPARYATVPASKPKEREIWDSQTLFKALESCQDERLKLCMNLAFSCSMRIGEVLGLTWDCVDISDESIAAGKAFVYINKQLQRVNKKVMAKLENKDIVAVFPEQTTKNTTVLVLKKPKTITSMRKVFLPKTVAEMLVKWKMDQDALIDALGDEYHNYNLVIAGSWGFPIEGGLIRKNMKHLAEACNIPDVCFHSLRHSSITYKLKLNGGDIKSVQGDSGHAQASMVTDQYSHILDESRQENARLFEEAFYGKQGAEVAPRKTKTADSMAEKADAAGMDPELLTRILSNPEMVNMLKMLSKTLG